MYVKDKITTVFDYFPPAAIFDKVKMVPLKNSLLRGDYMDQVLQNIAGEKRKVRALILYIFHNFWLEIIRRNHF